MGDSTLPTETASKVPTVPLPPSRCVGEKRVDAACSAVEIAQKAARCRVSCELSKMKTPLADSVQQQEPPPERSNTWRKYGDSVDGDNVRSFLGGGDGTIKKGSSEKRRTNRATDASCIKATISTGRKRAAEALEIDSVSKSNAAPVSLDRSAPVPQLYTNSDERQPGGQVKSAKGNSNSITATTKAASRAKSSTLKTPHESASKTSSSKRAGGRPGVSSSTKRGGSAPTSFDINKEALLGSLLMPDGVTVRKPPPLGISSGDPVGTHILRRRATSMRTEQFSSSGLNLSLHRHAAANNSMFSWQRSFQSGSRGAASASFSSSSSAKASSGTRRTRGSSFMGKPVESLPRLVAFSPSLSKALKQHEHLIPAPIVKDTVVAENPTATSAASVTSPGAVSTDASPTASSSADAASSSYAAMSARAPSEFLYGMNTPHAKKLPQDTREKEGMKVSGARASTTKAATGTTSETGEADSAGGTGIKEDVTIGDLRTGVRETKASKAFDVHDLRREDETATAAYTASGGYECYASAISASPSVSEVRRRAGVGADGKKFITGERQVLYAGLQQPMDSLSCSSKSTDQNHGSGSRSDISSSGSSKTSSSTHSDCSSTIDSGSSTTSSATYDRTPHGSAVCPASSPPACLIPSVKNVDSIGTHESKTAFAADTSDDPAFSGSSLHEVEMTSPPRVAAAPTEACFSFKYVKTRDLQEAMKEDQHGEQPLPVITPAFLYQLGITKFTEGKAPEAIEVITKFLRDAAAKKRPRQRQRQKSNTSSDDLMQETSATQSSTASAVNIIVVKDNMGDVVQEASSNFPSPQSANVNMDSASAPSEVTLSGKTCETGIYQISLIPSPSREAAAAAGGASKSVEDSTAITTSTALPSSIPGTVTDASAVPSEKSISPLDELCTSAAAGCQGADDSGDHTGAGSPTVTEKQEELSVQSMETQQQQEKGEEANMRVRMGEKESPNTKKVASDKRSDSGKDKRTGEGGSFPLPLHGKQLLSTVHLHDEANAVEAAHSPRHSHGSPKGNLPESTPTDVYIAEDQDVDTGVNESCILASSSSDPPQNAPADVATPHRTSTDVSSAELPAADAAVADAIAADAVGTDAAVADATAAGAAAAVDGAGADLRVAGTPPPGADSLAAKSPAADILTADPAAAPAAATAYAGANVMTLTQEILGKDGRAGQLTADRMGVDAASSVGAVGTSKDQEVVTQSTDHHVRASTEQDTGTKREDRDVSSSEELEAVPVQDLFGIILSKSSQIDRRAKDLISGWGTPQYLHLEKLLGHLLFEEGDYSEAIRHYWRCIDLRPDDSQLYTNLGLAYYETGATKEATASFEQALKCDDRNPVALSVLAMLLMDTFETAEDELDQREAENAEQGGKVTPADEKERLERLLKATDRCVTLLRRCVEVEEDNVLAVLHLAQVHMYREEWDEAETIFRALLQDNGNDTHLLNNLGQIAMYRGDTIQAVQLFERALRINPQDELVHMHICEAFCRLQHLGALQHFRLCCEASPDSVSLHATCGLPLCEAGKEKEVVAAYTAFIKQHPESAAAKTFRRSLGYSSDGISFAESSQIVIFIVLPILLLMVFLIGMTQLVSYWSTPVEDRAIPASWESLYYPPDAS